jgi:DeoR family transcriptional regulator, carbon catabolite repression regulator
MAYGIMQLSGLSKNDRLMAICAHLSKQCRMGIGNICRMFDVTRDTARRDLIRLDAERRILRVRGGGVLPPVVKQVDSYQSRQQASAEKCRIGEAAANLIRANEHVLLDTSTTVLQAARAI